MHGRRSALVAAALIAISVMAIGGLTFLVFEQRKANQQILSELDRVRTSIARQDTVARELRDQVASLSGRVAELERRTGQQANGRTGQQPIGRASPLTLPPLESRSNAPYAEHSTIEHPDTLAAPLPITWSTDWTAYQPAGSVSPPRQAAVPRKLTEPVFVKGMYASMIGLQAADVMTTTRAINRGGIEANPFARGYVNSPAAMIGVKAGVTIGTILITEKLRKEHPVQASLMLVTINAMLAAVVINNASVNFDP